MRRWLRLGSLASALGVAACGFPRPPDLASDAAAPRCDPLADFGTAMPLRSINTSDFEEQANLSGDENTLYFSSLRASGLGGYDIYQASRKSKSLPFGDVALVTGVNTDADEREPRITRDQRSMFAIQSAAGQTMIHIMLATRTNTTAAFGRLEVLDAVNGSGNDSDPYISPDGTVMYLSSNRHGDYGLYRSAKTGAAFSTPAPVGGVDLDTLNREGNPVVTPDELTLFFASDRPGTGGFDIYEARRPSVADGFGAAIELRALNTPAFDAPNWISDDGCALYFTRNDPDFGNELFVAVRGR